MDVHGRLELSEIEIPSSEGLHPLASWVGDTVCLGFGDEKNLGENCKILVRPDPGECQEQAGATLVGMATRFSYVARKCGCNAHNAMCNRHGVKQPPVTRRFGVFFEFLDEIGPETESIYNELLNHYEVHWLTDRWSMAKQLLFEDSLWLDAVLLNRVKNMVKREGQHSKPKKARCIQYYVTLASQAYAGPEFYSLQKAYTQVLVRRGHRIRVSFASGMNATDLGDWLSGVMDDYSFPHFYERDGKSWDATMGSEHQRLKTHAYRFGSDRLKEMASKGFKVKGLGRYGNSVLKYSLNGTTKSGHNDTTLGNSLVNAGIAFEAMAIMGLRGDILVAGDDLLIAVDGDFDEDELARIESGFGIIPEYRKFNHYLDVTFISGCWFPRDQGFVFTPKAGRLLARLFWTVNPPTERSERDYRHSVVAGLLPTCGGMPVVGAFLRANDPGGNVVTLPKDKDLSKYSVEVKWDESILRAFCDKYDLTEAEVRVVELRLACVKGAKGLLVDSTLDKIMDCDLSDIADRPVVGTNFTAGLSSSNGNNAR